MTVKALKSFFDKKEGVTRNMGDTFTVSSERYKELNSTQFGILVEEVAEATKSVEVKKSKAAPQKPAKK
jgi:hypothetical protein